MTKEDNRKFIFDFYRKHIGMMTQREIAKELGYPEARFTKLKKKAWWKQMEKDYDGART